MIRVEDYDKEALLSYLNTCTEKRTISRAGGYSIDDVAVEIVIVTAGKTKQILLGNINYSSAGAGARVYQIQNSQEALASIKRILNLDSDLEE